MQLVPESDRNLEQATQRRVNEHAKLQRDYGKNLERVDVSGYGLHNWFDSKKEITLLQKLMSLDSITEKVIGMGKNQRNFTAACFMPSSTLRIHALLPSTSFLQTGTKPGVSQLDWPFLFGMNSVWTPVSIVNLTLIMKPNVGIGNIRSADS